MSKIHVISGEILSHKCLIQVLNKALETFTTISFISVLVGTKHQGEEEEVEIDSWYLKTADRMLQS